METLYKSKLNKVISTLPKSEQKQFQDAIQTRKFTSEIGIPKKLNHKRPIEGKNYFRNIIINFNKAHKNRQNIISKMHKHTKEFSKNYDSVVNDTVPGKLVIRHLDTYCDLIAKYTDMGYDKDNLFPEANIFQPSLLLQHSNRFENVHIIGDPTETENDQYFMAKTSAFIDKRKHNTLSHSMNLTQRQSKPRASIITSSTLEYESPYKKRNTIRKSRNELTLLPGIIKINSSSVKKENKQMKRNIRQIQECLYNVENELYTGGDVTIMNSTAMKTASVKENEDKNQMNNNVFLLSKAKKRNTMNALLKSTITPFEQRDYNKTHSVVGQYTINSPQKRRTVFRMNTISNDLEKLYDKTLTTPYHKSYEPIIKYFEDHNLKPPDCGSKENGSNLKGIINDFETKIKRRNLPELLRQLKIKTSDFSLGEHKIDAVKEMDDNIRELEFDYVEDILKINKFI